MYLRGKYKYKHNKEIEKLLKNKMKSEVLEEECTDIITYMYNEDDSQLLLDRLSAMYYHKKKDRSKM